VAVYVDNSRNKFRGMVMCHMVADTPGELHNMADSIGIKIEHFQGDARTPHYDLSISKRNLAISKGAIEVNRKQLGKVIRSIKKR